MHLVYPTNILRNHCFQFLLGITDVLRGIEENGCKEMGWEICGGGGGRGGWGKQRALCIMVYVKIVNRDLSGSG